MSGPAKPLADTPKEGVGFIRVVPVKWRGGGDRANRDSPAGRVHVFRLRGGFSAQSRTFCAKGFERAFGVPVPARTTVFRVRVEEVRETR